MKKGDATVKGTFNLYKKTRMIILLKSFIYNFIEMVDLFVVISKYGSFSLFKSDAWILMLTIFKGSQHQGYIVGVDS